MKLVHQIDIDRGIHLDVVDSTNTYIRNPAVATGSWVTAKEQTKGRGRGGNQWIALGEERLIFSAKVETEVNDIAPFPLLAGGAVLKACRHSYPEAAADLSLKWPNDIFRRDKKIGGLLIEAEKGIATTIIIGIGINISGGAIPAELSAAGYLLDAPMPGHLANLTRRVVEQINQAILCLDDETLRRREIAWIYENSFLRGRQVSVPFAGEVITGTVCGYSPSGFLRIAQGDAEVQVTDAAAGIQWSAS